MRITDRPATTGVGATGGASRSGAASSRFSLGGSDAPGRIASAQSAAPAGALDGLIALQAAGDSLERRKRAMRRGHGLLDSLDRLKIALLSGHHLPAQQLANLSQQLRQARDDVDDPSLADILAHVELRAEVEMAKLSKR